MDERALDPERGKAVAKRLKELNRGGILVTAATKGYITELACAMPECLCPEELGGRGYFDPKTSALTDWMPTPDHFPILKKDGGHLTVENVRLAHRLCNRVDYAKNHEVPYAKDLARVKEARLGALENPKG